MVVASEFCGALEEGCGFVGGVKDAEFDADVVLACDGRHGLQECGVGRHIDAIENKKADAHFFQGAGGSVVIGVDGTAGLIAHFLTEFCDAMSGLLADTFAARQGHGDGGHGGLGFVGDVLKTDRAIRRLGRELCGARGLGQFAGAFRCGCHRGVRLDVTGLNRHSESQQFV